MLFRRRNPAAWPERLRETVWPRRGFLRKLRYHRIRVMRVAATPHSIAAGLAAGMAMAWTPFLGFHVVLALILAYLLSGNMFAAALGTTASNPLTFPLIGAVTWESGKWLLGGASGGADGVNLAVLFETLKVSELWAPVLKPMLVGAVPFAGTTALLAYILTFVAVRRFQAGRRTRLAARSRPGDPVIAEEISHG